MDKDFLQFLKELPSNNNREWFTKNKKRYQESVQKPFEELVLEITRKLDVLMPGVGEQSPKDSVFRIYRDVRFSKDKSPYKNHVSALISSGGKKDKTRPGMYLEASAEGVRIYSGSHMLEKEQLKAVRDKIVREPDRFKELKTKKDFKEAFGEILGEKNKKLAPEYSAIQNDIPEIANKSFYYGAKLPASEILNKDFPETALRTMKIAIGMNNFLEEALKGE